MNPFDGYDGSGSGSGNTSNNAIVIGKAKDLQDEMLESLDRAGQCVNEIKENGNETMAQLEHQAEKLENIIESLDRQEEVMNDAEKEQDRLAFWTCNFFYKCKANKGKKKKRNKNKNKNKDSSNSNSNSNNNNNNNTTAPRRRGPLPGEKQNRIAALRDELLATKGERPTAHILHFGKSKGSGPHLTEAERKDLTEIAEKDRRVDEKLDELGQETRCMLDQAMFFGQQVEKQNKLYSVAKNKMENNEDQLEELNQRTQTFLPKK
eukprot:CAMPEP_0172394622 /NCGR_PEP_ID=MMETSP1061-20121228/15643_1 /TAXON_ID=37318 /ORGANISM="Pseudo-nitzschia pungens, Strain cf. pungens" /LENGTH=263 /DNA_ID=CAMNT_0013126021 /DNA_START=161 /DNA_END=952 /DNA_ORIENTATION=+